MLFLSFYDSDLESGVGWSEEDLVTVESEEGFGRVFAGWMLLGRVSGVKEGGDETTYRHLHRGGLILLRGAMRRIWTSQRLSNLLSPTSTLVVNDNVSLSNNFEAYQITLFVVLKSSQ
jgi:hypothetical protein